MDKYKFCKYYKGEEKPPYESGTSENTFWHLEENYWNQEDPRNSFCSDHKRFEDEARAYIEANKDKKNFMTSDAPIEQKGFVMFAEAMLQKWIPYDVDIIFKY